MCLFLFVFQQMKRNFIAKGETRPPATGGLAGWTGTKTTTKTKPGQGRPRATKLTGTNTERGLGLSRPAGGSEAHTRCPKGEVTGAGKQSRCWDQLLQMLGLTSPPAQLQPVVVDPI